jgi:phage-related protein
LEIFKLFGSILVDNEEANKSISATDKKAEGLAGKLKSVIGTAAKVGAGIAAGVGAAGATLLGIANKTAETTDRIDKLSQKIGVSRQGFQEWEFILSQSGTDIEKLQMGMKTLVTQVDQADKGVGKGADNFARLGVSVRDSTGSLKDQETLFNEVMVALQNMEDGTEKARIANELLGRSGSELMPLLNGAAGSIDAMKQQVQELGLVIGDDAVDAGVVFTDTMDQIKRTLGAVMTNIGAEVMPMFQSLLDWVMSHMPEIQATFSTVFGVVNTVVTKAYEIFNDNILPVLISVYDWVQSNMPTFKAIFNTVFGAIWDIASQVWHIFTDNLLPILKALYEFIEPTFPVIGEIIKNAFEIVVGVVRTAVDIFDKLTSGIKTAIDWLKKWNNTEAKEKNTSIAENARQYGGARANGGHVDLGKSYLVGERGPELFTPSSAGNITPNNELGGTQEITVNIPVVLEGKAVTNIVSKIQLDNTRGRARAVGVSI